MKKTISLIISLVMILCLPTNVWATEKLQNESFTISEYDMYVNIRKTDVTSLLKDGISEKSIDYIKSNTIEKQLLERAMLSEVELAQKYGYNQKQIQILKNYDGAAIETRPELRGLLANVDGYYRCMKSSTTEIFIQAYWEWSQPPFNTNEVITDLVVIRWQGTNLAGQPINLKPGSAYCNVDYYQQDTLKEKKVATVVVDDAYSNVHVKVKMASDNNYLSYAKKGMIGLQLTTIGTAQLKETAFSLTYGHSYLTVIPSFSLPVGLGVNFSSRVEKMCHKVSTIDNKGIITNY